MFLRSLAPLGRRLSFASCRFEGAMFSEDLHGKGDLESHGGKKWLVLT